MPESDTPTPIVMAWSGGKDSAMALQALRRDPRWQPIALLTAVTREYDRVSIHGVRRALLEQQAEAIGLPLVIAWLEPVSSNAEYEAAWQRGLDDVRVSAGDSVRHIAYGDLFLEDVRAYRDAQCAALGWTPVYPLWSADTATLARSFIADGYEAVLTCVDTQQLDADFAGRWYDDALLAELPATVDPCGERGEFHTFVSHAPCFSAHIEISVGERIRRDARFEYADVVPISTLS